MNNADFDFAAAFARKPVILAPMEELSCAIFRRICRARGADICVTEFALADALFDGDKTALRKITLAPSDAPTAIQIYGANPERLAEAASIAEAQQPAFIDINCGCWVPKVARGGAGAGWLRDPDAMVAMAAMVVRRVSLPVTVKTRLGWGDEDELPILQLAQKLEAVGVRAITLHCRTARMGHTGQADWSWARRVREVVDIPVIVNGDVRTANDAQRAIESTGCAGVMIGRRALEHPFVFREARARLDHAPKLAAPSFSERTALCREHLLLLEAEHGPVRALRAMGQWFPRYLGRLPDASEWVRELRSCPTLDAALETLECVAEAH
ncbi:MAG TPA: tRNA-dihydrouridine synthase family protein [Polyangiales bacterium]|nr:tRNA-dihydrouridine synthase family protein [Polyangiales bacterium]